MGPEAKQPELDCNENISFVEALRLISAQFQIAPEEVSRTMDEIKQRWSTNAQGNFEKNIFRLEFQHAAEGDRAVLDYNGIPYVIELIAYRGQTHSENKMVDIRTLRIVEDPRPFKSAPTARPAEKGTNRTLRSNPFASRLSHAANDEDMETDGDVDADTAETCVPAGSLRKVLGANDGPNSFRAKVFGLLQGDE